MNNWPPHSDHVYATKHGVPISLRLWPSPNVDPNKPAPFVLWTHGGAFVFGLFTDVISWVVPAFTSRGYHVVSVDYRLTPIANIEHMLEDATDAFKWCRTNLPLLIPGGKDAVDIDRYIVGGDSAGGCLSTLLAHRLQPSPRAVIDDHGLVDLADLHYDTLHRIVPFSGKFTPSQVQAAVKDRDLSRAMVEVANVDLLERLGGVPGVRIHFDRHEYDFTDRDSLQLDCRAALYAESAWVRSALHAERFKTDDEFIAYAKTLSSYWLLVEKQKEGKGKDAYPPTFFVHGEADPTVHVAHSRKMANKLKEMGIETLEYYEAGQDHVFDKKFTDPDIPGWDECVGACLDFMDRHVKA